MKKSALVLFLSTLFLFACTPKIEVKNIHDVCDFSIFHGLEPNMEIKDFFTVLGQPNEYLDGRDDEGTYHCPVYYFTDYKLKCNWDGDYHEMGTIEFIPYDNVNYTIDEFIKNPQQYGIDENATRFNIYSDGIWYFEVFLDNNRVKSIQYWLGD